MAEANAGKPRLLVLASTYPRWRGDPEPGFVHELCRRLTREFQVTALVPDAPGADRDGELDGVNVVRYRYAPRGLQTLVNGGGIAVNLKRSRWKWLLVPGFLAMQALAAWRLCRRGCVDVVHAHWLVPQGLVALFVAPTPFLVTSHGGDLFGLRGGLANLLKRRVARAAGAMTVVSTAMREETRRLGLEPPRIEVLPMGVDLRERFVPAPHVTRSVDELLFVGRLVAKKGLNVLLDAMPEILRARPQVRLRIAGFGPEEPVLRAQVARLGLQTSVEFLGATPQAELPALYHRAALLVAPFIRDDSGNQEGLPVVLMEAIGCACPVVVGDVAGVQDLLGDAHADIRVPPGDAAALARAVLASLADPFQAQQRATSIRADVEGWLDWDRIASAYARLLHDCLKPPAHVAPNDAGSRR